jgi:hypothetical protein
MYEKRPLVNMPMPATVMGYLQTSSSSSSSSRKQQQQQQQQQQGTHNRHQHTFSQQQYSAALVARGLPSRWCSCCC